VAKLSAASELADEEKQALRDLCSNARTFPPRRDIISEGDKPTHVHIVMEGWAARYKILPDGSRQIVAFLIPGDFCDLHVTILARMDHSILALTETKVAYAPHEAMEALPIDHPRIGRAFWRATLVDEAVLRSWIVNIGRRDSAERIAHLFCELHARMSLVGLVEEGQFDLPLTQEVIADAVGLTPVHVNRTLQALRAQGLIVLRDGELTITDVEKLREVAGFDANYLHRGRMIRA
jgi:CRP-like cAMP-binding protein